MGGGSFVVKNYQMLQTGFGSESYFRDEYGGKDQNIGQYIVYRPIL